MRTTRKTKLLEVIRSHPEGLSKAEALRQAGLRQWGRGREYLRELEATGVVIVQRDNPSSATVKPAKEKRK